MGMIDGVSHAVWGAYGGMARAWGSVGLLSVLSGVTLASPPADVDVSRDRSAEERAPAEDASSEPTAPLLTPRQQQQERRRWRQTLREQPLWSVARARYGRGEAPQVISRLADDPTQATQVRQRLAGGVTYTSTRMLGAFAMWSRLELPAMPDAAVDGLVHDVQSALAAGAQRWQSQALSDGSLSYQTADLSAAFRLHVTPAGVVIDTYDAVNSDDVVWRVASELFEPAGSWSVTERLQGLGAQPSFGVGIPAQVEQSFSGGIHYTRDIGGSHLSMPSAQEEQVAAVVAALMELQAPNHEWGIHPWAPGDRTFYAALEEVGGSSDTDRHRLPFWVHQSGGDVEIWLSHPAMVTEPLWWHVAEHVAPTAPPTASENGWLGYVTSDHRVAWSGRGGRFCQEFSQGFVFCDEVDQLTPHAMVIQGVSFPEGHDAISRAILSGLVEETRDGAAWRPIGLTEELLSSCQVSASAAGIDLYCSRGIDTWLSVEPF